MKKSESVNVGQRLVNCREYLGYSQKEVATYLCCHLKTLQHYESGIADIPSSVLQKLGRLYSRPASYFLDEEEENHPQITNIDTSFLKEEDIRELISFAKFLRYRRELGNH